MATSKESGEKDDASINFLLANVNENDHTKNRPVDRPSTFQSSSPSSTSYSTNYPLTNEDLSLKSLVLWLGLGFLAMVGLMIFFILLGVYASSTAALIIWLWTWLFVCCGAFWCAFRRPNGLHLCNGITVALILGVLAMASFSIVRDISSRILYGQVDVSSIPSFVPLEGSIVYFENGGVDLSYLASSAIKKDPACEGNQCSLVYMCVAPVLIPSLNLSSTPISFWVGCEVGKDNQPCTSDLFLNSECYTAWKEPYKAGFTYGGELLAAFIQAVNSGVSEYQFQPSPNNIVVEWVPDPLEQAKIFNRLGWCAVGFSPLIYFVYGIVFAVACGKRFQMRREYETIPEK